MPESGEGVKALTASALRSQNYFLNIYHIICFTHVPARLLIAILIYGYCKINSRVIVVKIALLCFLSRIDFKDTQRRRLLVQSIATVLYTRLLIYYNAVK